MANYTKQWSTATPGYLIFLVDQSSSMDTIWENEKKFSEITSEILNQTINELIATNAAGESVKDRVFVSIIGYGGNQDVINLRSDYLSKYADSPLRIQNTEKEVSDGEGGKIIMQMQVPVFVEPKASGLTPMAGAFEIAKKLISGWIAKKNDNPVPVIINISDGQPEGDGPIATEQEKTNTIAAANQIRQMETEDGRPLIFNVHIGEKKDQKEVQFPQYKFELNGNAMAEFLFEISSEVPETYIKAAKDLNLKSLEESSKGFITNASPETLIKFINFGSSGGVDRATGKIQ